MAERVGLEPTNPISRIAHLAGEYITILSPFHYFLCFLLLISLIIPFTKNAPEIILSITTIAESLSYFFPFVPSKKFPISLSL